MSPTPLPRHLLTVWNPAYASDAMEAHGALLLDLARRFRAGEVEEDDVYVWWGKIRSPNRQQPMAHLREILAIDAELGAEHGVDEERHLYLTDYRSLYVAAIGEVTADDVRDDDAEHVPAFYSANGHACDCWFRLFDIRRVVADDTLGVVRELQKLRNTRYHDRPVSIYGGMVELPLIVTRDDGARYFDPRVRAQLTDGKFWIEFDAEHSGLGQMERELRQNLFGDVAWEAFDPAARTFIATAEKIFRDHRDDPGFDFSPVLVDFAKALEVQCNLLLWDVLRAAPAEARRALVDGRTIDVVADGPLSLGALAHAIGEERALNDWLKVTCDNGQWFAASLPPILRQVAVHRNPAAHRTRLGREDALALRNWLMGIGQRGVFMELAAVRR